MNVIGSQVQVLRKQKGLSQKDVAARCNVLGWDLSRSTLAKIESHVRRVTDYEAVLLARAFRVDIADLYEAVELDTAIRLCRGD